MGIPFPTCYTDVLVLELETKNERETIYHKLSITLSAPGRRDDCENVPEDGRTRLLGEAVGSSMTEEADVFEVSPLGEVADVFED